MTQPLRITGTPVSTIQLVTAAVAAHKITPQQGLMYRVFAAFGDQRLPAAYGGDAAVPDDEVMRDVVSQWSTLSLTQRSELRPFFTPPAAKGSWLSGQTSGAAAADRLSEDQPSCVSASLENRHWLSIAGKHVRIWWLQVDDARVGAEARQLLSEIEDTIWPRLSALLGREPLSDGSEPCFHGGDGLYDIYLLRLDRQRALTVAYPPLCTGTPAFTIFDVASSAPRPWEVAHELMHAFQFAYHYHDPCSAFDNWDEATANWAANYVYPHDNTEHVDDYFWPETPLLKAGYEGWVFPYAMERLHGAATIADIYRQTEHLGLAEAIDAGVPGGLAQAWPEFALKAWNQDPVYPSFRQWDNYDVVPWVKYQTPIPIENLGLGTTGQQRADVPLDLPPLTRRYAHFKFGLGVTEVSVSQPSVPGIHVDAILRYRDGTSQITHWTGGQQAICARAPGRRLDELVLVISNPSPTQAGPANQPLTVLSTDVGCTRYTGTISGLAEFTPPNRDYKEKWSGSLVFTRADNNTMLQNFLFNLTGGSVTWSLSGTQDGCSISAGPITLPVRSDGYNGDLNLNAFIDQPDSRHYDAWGNFLPPVDATLHCSTGTYTESYSPHQFLATSDGFHQPAIPADGILAGTYTYNGDPDRTVTYNYRLVPET
jgi:hypothetical protein